MIFITSEIYEGRAYLTDAQERIWKAEFVDVSDIRLTLLTPVEVFELEGLRRRYGYMIIMGPKG